MMNEARREGVSKAIHETGPTILFEPDKPAFDIVFIHGFTGHPERTWTSKKGNARNCNDDHVAEPPSKIRKLNPFSSSHHRKNGISPAVYWPRDLVPTTIPNARVLTYGYDTHIRHWVGPPVNRNTVYDIAWDLLVSLESERRCESSRPVIFIVHSLGGIIVKELLRRSKSCSMGQAHLREVFESTVGIMFFGTPHAGSDPRGFLQHIAEKVIKATGFSVNEQIVNTLLPSSERLRELRDEFGLMAQEQNWIIHSFQEQYGIKALIGQKVVDDMSSYLNVPAVEITEHIGRDHMEMCRFTGFNDTEYKKVAAALCRMTTSASKQTPRGILSSLSKAQKQKLLDSLRFDQIDARHMTIKNAHAKTCRWLLERLEYLDWLDLNKLDKHHGFLWIKGKPGAGKSTLMKFILADARKKLKGKIITSFFFNARGDYLEKSTTGMYRSLLLQLLERLPRLQNVFHSLEITTWISEHYHWSVEALKALFEQAVQGLGKSSLVCFIDALDECDEYQIRDMISFFEHIGKLTVSADIRFNVCFASRHYPHITIEKRLDLSLEEQEEHNRDIVSYLDSELKIGNSKLAEQIRVDLKLKAAGVFMWVVLVVQILNKEYDDGHIHALRQRLRDIPGDLHELFRNILTRDRNNTGELLLCIQWVLFSRKPLRPEQLYFAILSGTEPDALSKWNPDETTAAVIERYILSSSKGLAEITKSEIPTVQFIHESVRDFLSKENELKAISSDFGSELRGESHDRLKQCCLDYMRLDISAYVDIDNSLPKASSQQAVELRQSIVKAFPFLDYAIHNVLYHADAAEGAGVDQMHFLQTFQITKWIKLNNLFERHQVRHHTPTASILYILAEHNMGNLIRRNPSGSDCFKIEDQRYGPPILAALATSSDEAVQALLQAQAKVLSPTSPFHRLYQKYCQDRNMQHGFRRDFTFSQRKGVLCHLVELGNELILLAFLNLDERAIDMDSYGRTLLSLAAGKGFNVVVKMLLRRECDIESKDRNGRTALSWAAGNGCEAVVDTLLRKDAELESKDRTGRTPLSWATLSRREAVVKLLAKKKADLESKDNCGCTALSIATRNSDAKMVRLLLENGADIESEDNDGYTALFLATRMEHVGLIMLLLENGANVESKNNNGLAPLLRAAQFGQSKVVELLLENGANIESKNNEGWTPLVLAAEYGQSKVVELLLEKGADRWSKDIETG